MNKICFSLGLRGAFLVGMVACALAPAPSYGAEDGCPKEPKKLEDLCKDKTGEEQKKCQPCGEALKGYNDKIGDFKKTVGDCRTKAATCGVTPGSASEGQYTDFSSHKTAAGVGEACKRDQKLLAKGMGAEQSKLCKKVKNSCQSVEGGEKETEKCEKDVADTKKAEKDAEKKEKDLGDKKDKSGDNAKKQDSKNDKADGGGGMPPIPPMPPQDKGGDEEATSPTPESPGDITKKEASELTSSKFDDGKGSGNGAMGSSDPNASKDGTKGADLGANPDWGVYDGKTDSIFGANALGKDGAFGSTGSSSGGVGGLGSGGGLAGSSGSSRSPDEAKAAEKAAESANPFEMPVGSGGRLGVPKGKSSGDSDVVPDAAATAEFKSDFDRAPASTEEQAAEGEEEDIGYTVFKMVRYRYSELKKKGNI